DATAVQSGSATDAINSTDSGIVVPKGYHVAAKNTVNGKDIKVTTTTNKDGQTIANIPASEIGKDGSNIVYTITKDAPKTGTVVVTVNEVDANGKVIKTLQESKQVQSATIGTKIDGADYNDVPSALTNGYHLVKATASGAGKNVKLTDGVVTGNVGDGVEHITYDVTKNAPKTGKVVVNVNVVDGKDTSKVLSTPVKGLEVQSGDVGTAISNKADLGNIPGVPKGYHLVGTTTLTKPEGSNATLGKDGETVTGAIADGTTEITYHIAKDAPVVNPPVKPETPKVGNVVVTINEVGSNGQVVKVLVNQETTVKEVKEGTAITNSNYTDVNSVVPKGYHLVSSSIVNATGGNGSVSKDGTVSGSVGNGTTQIVYNIEKDAPVVNPPVKPVNPTPVQKTGKVTVKVVDNNGNVVVKQHTVTEGNVGGAVTGTGYTPEKGSHIVGITINGKEVKVVPDMKIPDGTTHIVYTIAKDPTPVNPTPVQKTGKVTVKVVDNNGNVVVKQHTVTEGNVGGAVTGTGYTPEKGSHIVGITINGKEVKVVPNMKIPDGTTHIVYTIAKDPTPAKPNTGDGDNTDSTPIVQPNTGDGNNTDSTPIVQPNTGDGDNTDSTPIVQPNTNNGDSTNSTPIVNNNNKIPVVSVNNKGVAKVDTLPDTGISNAIPSNAAKDAAGIAGLLGIIGLGFLFKRKK
ncbi:MAG: hypothetical protein ACRC6T_06560, partial [Sarcina sp.]